MPGTAKRGNDELQVIPGVGPNMAETLRELGYRRPEDLRGADPEAMYDRICALHGGYVDRCVLYVFRTAVYYADHERHDPERLKWWNWKDR